MTVIVKPNAKKNKVVETGEGRYVVRVHAPPHDGKANDMAVKVLAEHFGVAKSRVCIVKGHSSKTKVVEIT